MVKVQRLFAKTNLKIPVCRTEYSVHSRLVFKRNQAAISILKEVFAMNETDYNARLYEKMKAEQDKYHLPFCTCYDIISMSTKTFGER